MHAVSSFGHRTSSSPWDRFMFRESWTSQPTFCRDRSSGRGNVDVEPLNSSPDLGFIRQSGSGPLCITGVVPMPALVLPEFPGTSGHRCVCSPLAGHEAVRVSARQAYSGSPVQGEGEWCPSPTHSPVLAILDVVLRADSSSISCSLSFMARSGTRDLEAVGMAHSGPQVLISSLSAEVQETIANARAPPLGSCTLPNIKYLSIGA